VSVETPLRVDLEPDLAQHSHGDSEGPLIDQQEKLLKLAVSDYIDRIVDCRGPRQRVITQPRPEADIRAAANKQKSPGRCRGFRFDLIKIATVGLLY